MDRNSNLYTFIFAVILVVGVAAALAFTATTLKPLQAENVRKEKMQNILSTIGVNVSRDEAGVQFMDFVKEELAFLKENKIKTISDKEIRQGKGTEILKDHVSTFDKI